MNGSPGLAAWRRSWRQSADCARWPLLTAQRVLAAARPRITLRSGPLWGAALGDLTADVMQAPATRAAGHPGSGTSSGSRYPGGDHTGRGGQERPSRLATQPKAPPPRTRRDATDTASTRTEPGAAAGSRRLTQVRRGADSGRSTFPDVIHAASGAPARWLPVPDPAELDSLLGGVGEARRPLPVRRTGDAEPLTAHPESPAAGPIGLSPLIPGDIAAVLEAVCRRLTGQGHPAHRSAVMPPDGRMVAGRGGRSDPARRPFERRAAGRAPENLRDVLYAQWSARIDGEPSTAGALERARHRRSGTAMRAPVGGGAGTGFRAGDNSTAGAAKADAATTRLAGTPGDPAKPAHPPLDPRASFPAASPGRGLARSPVGARLSASAFDRPTDDGPADLSPMPVPGWPDPAEEEERLGGLAADLRRILVAEAIRHGIPT